MRSSAGKDNRVVTLHTPRGGPLTPGQLRYGFFRYAATCCTYTAVVVVDIGSTMVTAVPFPSSL